jgi:hypothetical protein
MARLGGWLLDILGSVNQIAGGPFIPQRKVWNWIAGENVDIAIEDDPAANDGQGATNITISSTGGGGGTPSDATPEEVGTAAAGSSEEYSRGDHSHALADGAVGTSHLEDGAVTNAKVAADAAIAGTKVSPDFGAQNVATTGYVSSASRRLTQSSGAPAAVASTTVQTRRTEDGALITRGASSAFKFELPAEVFATSSTAVTEFASIHLPNNSLTVVDFSIMAGNATSGGASLGETISYTGRVQFRCDNAGAVTVEESWLATPDAKPVVPPAWCTAYASLVTTDVATANRGKLRFTPAASANVKWSTYVEGRTHDAYTAVS